MFCILTSYVFGIAYFNYEIIGLHTNLFINTENSNSYTDEIFE